MCFLFCPSAAILYTSCILVGIFINSSVPIFFELFIETVYPVPEGITCGVVTFLGNLVTGLLLFFLTFYCTGKTVVLHIGGVTECCLLVLIIDIMYLFKYCQWKSLKSVKFLLHSEAFSIPAGLFYFPKATGSIVFKNPFQALQRLPIKGGQREN